MISTKILSLKGSLAILISKVQNGGERHMTAGFVADTMWSRLK